MLQPLTVTQLFAPAAPPLPDCRRYGSAIAKFVAAQADAILDLKLCAEARTALLNVVGDASIDEVGRRWAWIRAAKGLERQMDYIMMKVAVSNFICQHGRMPTLEDIVGEDGGEFDDSSNFEIACEKYVEPTWPSEFDNKDAVKKAAMNALFEYINGIYVRAREDHQASRRHI